jgi:hypothetical protein
LIVVVIKGEGVVGRMRRRVAFGAEH